MSSLALKSTLRDRELALLNSEMPNRSKSLVVAFLLWFFLGTLGVYNFYLGNSSRGWLMVILTIVAFITLIVLIGFVIFIGLFIFVDRRGHRHELQRPEDELPDRGAPDRRDHRDTSSGRRSCSGVNLMRPRQVTS